MNRARAWEEYWDAIKKGNTAQAQQILAQLQVVPTTKAKRTGSSRKSCCRKRI